MKKTKWVTILGLTIIYLLLLSVGFILGMVYQQKLITQEIGTVLSYTNLEINMNINTTKFTEELKQDFIPAWKEAFNQTVSKQVYKEKKE